MLSILRCLCALSLLPSLILGQYLITQPDSTQPDLSLTYTLGDSMDISWNAGAWWTDGPPYADLHITWYRSDSYTALVLANRSLATAGFYRWRVNVSEEAVRTSNEFVLRFTKARNPPSYLDAPPGGMRPSRGFKLQLASTAISSLPTPVSIASSSIGSSAISNTASASSSASATSAANTNDKSGPPIGAIVGGVLGGLGLIALVVIAFFLFRLMKRKNAHEAPPNAHTEVGGYDPNTGYPQMVAPKYQETAVAQELDGGTIPFEADSNYRGEDGHGR